MSKLVAKEYKRFEDIKKVREDGTEFWSARELAPALDYTKWENFSKVIKRAMIACENSGHEVLHDFPEVRKIVDAGATNATKVHYAVGKEVRTAIEKIGGTMPEDLPTPEKSIQQIEKEQMARLKEKARKGKLMLDE